MQYRTSSKQEEYLFFDNAMKRSGLLHRNPQANSYFHGTKKLQYNRPSLVEENPSYNQNNHRDSPHQVGVHFVPREKYSKHSNKVHNHVFNKESHQIQNSKNIYEKQNNQIDKNNWNRNSIDSRSKVHAPNYNGYAPSDKRLIGPKLSFEEDHQPQPANFDNGEYVDSNNQPQAANYYHPIKPHHPYRGDQGGYDDSTSDPDAPPYIPQHRIIHLDFKGAPPKIDYLVKVLKLASNLGATGVLLEYEDMFPFKGQLSKVAATNHYNVTDIMAILDACQQLNLEVIPLVQTFGHMEFILKLAEFAHLRDAEDMPESICSCDEKAMPLIENYIDQIMAMHPNVRYLHIGCDEVFHMGECESCIIKGK